MTEKRLKNFKNLNREILTLDWELSEINRRIRNLQETEGAYSLLDDPAEELTAVQRALKKKIRKCWKERLALEKWLDSVEDSQIRQAIRLRYVEGLTWQQAALRLGYQNESTARIMVYRFLGK